MLLNVVEASKDPTFTLVDAFLESDRSPQRRVRSPDRQFVSLTFLVYFVAFPLFCEYWLTIYSYQSLFLVRDLISESSWPCLWSKIDCWRGLWEGKCSPRISIGVLVQKLSLRRVFGRNSSDFSLRSVGSPDFDDFIHIVSVGVRRSVDAFWSRVVFLRFFPLFGYLALFSTSAVLSAGCEGISALLSSIRSGRFHCRVLITDV